MKYVLASIAAITLSGVSAAQEGGASPEMDSALAAGWKAAFTCSGLFTSKVSLDTIEANELDGIYPDFQIAYDDLPEARIDRVRKIVSVDWSATLPPRIAVWRSGFGCTQLPIGADVSFTETLGHISNWPSNNGPDTARAIGDNARIRQDRGFYGSLEVPLSFAFDGKTYGEGTRTSAVVVMSQGEIVGEKYARGITATTPQRTWSVAKSISVSVIGAANYAGLFDYEGRTALEGWDTPSDPRQAITTKHLLHMASGLDSGARGNRTDRLYFGGGRLIDNATGQSLEAAPGKRWKYANNDTLLAMRALRERLDDDGLYARLPYEKLLWKIGATHTTLETDWNGDYLSSSQIWTTARDMARLGQLYLQDGIWRGERILPEGWSRFVSTPAPAQPVRGDGYGYGAQFWLMNNVEGVPADTYAALGNRGQSIVIVPSRNVVIVRRGFDVNGGTRFDLNEFTRTVLRGVEAMETERAEADRLAEEAREAERALSSPAGR
jgi:CubicO group peptidase (beta-lactamase class C family)